MADNAPAHQDFEEVSPYARFEIVIGFGESVHSSLSVR